MWVVAQHGVRFLYSSSLQACVRIVFLCGRLCRCVCWLVRFVNGWVCLWVAAACLAIAWSYGIFRLMFRVVGPHVVFGVCAVHVRYRGGVVVCVGLAGDMLGA